MQKSILLMLIALMCIAKESHQQLCVDCVVNGVEGTFVRGHGNPVEPVSNPRYRASPDYFRDDAYNSGQNLHPYNPFPICHNCG